MSGAEDLAQAIPSGAGAKFLVGVVETVTNATRLEVMFGQTSYPVTVPSTLAGAAAVGSEVRVSLQENSRVLHSVRTGAWIGETKMLLSATIPSGWLLLDGSTFSSATYPFLYALLGSTTLPDLRDKFPIGKSGTKALASTGGSSTISTAQLPSHTHGPGAGTNFVNGYQSVEGIQSGSGKTAGDATHTSTATAAAGSGSAYWQPYVAVNFIIKAA